MITARPQSFTNGTTSGTKPALRQQRAALYVGQIEQELEVVIAKRRASSAGARPDLIRSVEPRAAVRCVGKTRGLERNAVRRKFRLFFDPMHDRSRAVCPSSFGAIGFTAMRFRGTRWIRVSVACPPSRLSRIIESAAAGRTGQ